MYVLCVRACLLACVCVCVRVCVFCPSVSSTTAFYKNGFLLRYLQTPTRPEKYQGCLSGSKSDFREPLCIYLLIYLYLSLYIHTHIHTGMGMDISECVSRADWHDKGRRQGPGGPRERRENRCKMHSILSFSNTYTVKALGSGAHLYLGKSGCGGDRLDRLPVI